MSMGEPRELIHEQCTSGYSWSYLPQIGTYQIVSNEENVVRVNTVTGESHVLCGSKWIKITEPATEQA